MRNLNFRFILSAVILYSLLAVFSVNAAPVRFNQVTQVINAKPGKAAMGGFSQLRLANGDIIIPGDGDGDDDGKKTKPAQDDRVITETRVDVVEEEVCDCEQPPVAAGGISPYYALLGLGAVPFLFFFDDDDDTKTPTTTPTTTPTMTPTMTPPTTPTPPEPVPEPMTILLFGTGLAGIGLAARRKFGKKDKSQTEE